MKKISAIYRFSLLAFFLILLSSCAGGLHSKQSVQLTAPEYLQLASKAQGVKKQNYLLDAMNAWLTTHEVKQAQRLANRLSAQNLPLPLLTKLRVLQAHIALLNQHTNRTLTLLRQIGANHKLLKPDYQIKYYRLYAKAYAASGAIIQSINIRRQLATRLTTPEAKKQNLWAIWQSLQTLNLQTLANKQAQTPSAYLGGWLSIAKITKQWESQPTQLIAHLKRWRKAHPSHPANALLPSSLQHKNLSPESSRHIALLLPLTGRYAPYAEAIRNGFFTAFYNQKERTGFAPKVSVIDTSKKNIKQVYKQAVAKGANFIVGPLSKSNVLSLAQSSKDTLPTVALNTLPTSVRPKSASFYEFGLSPADEAQQAAEKAWQDHLKSALVIAPKNNWGQGVANAFIAQWKSLGGNIIATQPYSTQASLSADIRQVLQVTRAYQNKAALQKLLHERIRYIPRRRKDFDSIFLVASPQTAKQIRPLLRFYFAGTIPVYAISETYPGAANEHHNRDLDGILFCDMPWILTPNRLRPTYLHNIQQRIKSLWPDTYARHTKFYALGVDAFDITSKFNKMLILPKLGTPAATGTLFITPTHHIYRQLVWAKMKKGRPYIVQ